MKYVLLAPVLLFSSVFVFWPLGELFILSTLRTNFITSQFVGLQNYTKALCNPLFVHSVVNSLAYIVLLVTITIGGALGISLLVMREPKAWQDTTRVLLYLPMISAGIIIAQVWRWVFHADGPINWLLRTDIRWFAHGYTAIPAISVIVGMSTIGGVIVVILAAVLGIDETLYDAARVDGASWWQIKTRIVVPLITPTLLVMSLISAIAAPQIFENIYALAPFEHSATVGWAIYVEAFQMSRHGVAAAMSVFLMLAMFGLSWVKQCVTE